MIQRKAAMRAACHAGSMMSAIECKLRAENYAFMAQLTDDAHLRKVYFRLSSIWRNKALRMLMAVASDPEQKSEAA